MPFTACDLSILIPVNSRPRHLDLVLASIAAAQLPTPPPAPSPASAPAALAAPAAGFHGELIVRHTGTDAAIGEVVRAWQARAPFNVSSAGGASVAPWRLIYAHEPVDSGNRSENRNAAVNLSTGARLIFLDADCIPTRDFLEAHCRLLTPGHFVCGDALRLSEPFSESLTAERVARDNPRQWITAEVAADQARRRARVSRHLKLGDMHKIPLQGGNFSCWRADLVAINGFDTAYAGWGQEDSDIGTRLFLSGRTPVNGVGQATALHIWHPPLDRPAHWKEGGNVGYFLRPGRMVRCRHGLTERAPADITFAFTLAAATTADATLTSAQTQVTDWLLTQGFRRAANPAHADWVVHLCAAPVAPHTTPHQLGLVLSAAGPGLFQRIAASLGGAAGWSAASWWLLAGSDPAATEKSVPQKQRSQVSATTERFGSPGWLTAVQQFLTRIG